MKFLKILFITSVLFSCTKENKTDVMSFREGNFKTYLGQRKDSSFFYRDAKIQIEQYKKRKDTFNVKWISNFEYQLYKVNPKNKLDSLPFIVKITSIKQDHYSFKAYYLGSNFKQEGKSYKLNN